MAYYPHAFDAEIVHHDLGSYRYTVVFLPNDLARSLPFEGNARLRMSGELGEVPFSGAWQPVRGRWYVMLSRSVLKAGPYRVGDRVELRFRLEPQDALDMPAALDAALAGDAAARAAWQGLTAGQRRGMAHHVGAAKTQATRDKRIAEVLQALCAGRKDLRPPRRATA